MASEPLSPSRLTVAELLVTVGARLDATVLEGRTFLDRPIVSPALQKTGLILAGMWEYYHPERLQLFGNSEVQFLRQTPDGGVEIARRLADGPVPAFLFTSGLEPPAALRAEAAARSIPILVTPRSTDRVVEVLVRFLTTRLAPSVRMHGVLMDIYGLGVLILGESGIGKSESALELVSRGHRLVADDSVEIRDVEDHLIGSPPALTRHLMEVRGLGIVNAVETFGVTSVLESKQIEQVVRLFRYEPGTPTDRLGVQRETEILGHALPLVEMPVAPGRNLAVLLEMSARQQLLRDHGRDASRELHDRLTRMLSPHSARGATP